MGSKILSRILNILFIFLLFTSPWRLCSGKPNLIVIVSEDHAVSAFGAFGKSFAETNPTPNLDKLASNGVLFTQAFCSNPMAGPGTAALLTGKFSHQNGFLKNGDKFNGAQTTLPYLLKEAGYETALFGKWNLGTDPMDFDYWQILADSDEFYNPEFWNPTGKKRIEGYSSDVITDLCLDWLDGRSNKEAPFFLMVQYNATRRPWMPAIRHVNLFDDILLPEPPNLIDDLKNRAPPARYQEIEIMGNLDLYYDLFSAKPDDWQPANALSSNLAGQKNILKMNEEQSSAWQLAWRPKNEALGRANLKAEALLRWKYQRFAKNYLRCIKGIDENIGRLTANISTDGKKGCAVVYTSNHGRFLGEHGWFGTHWMYEESQRIPLLISGKFKENPGPKIVNDVLALDIDLSPTILNLMDIEIPRGIQGRTLLSLPEGNSTQTFRPALYFHYHEFPGEQMVPKHNGIRTKTKKLIHYYQFDEWEFFDLEKDPSESNNLLKKETYQKEITELKSKLEKLREFYGDSSDISVMPEEWRRIYRSPDARKKEL